MSNQVQRNSRFPYGGKSARYLLVNADQAIPTGNYTTVVFDTTNYNNIDSLTYAAGVFTFSKTGVYSVTANLSFTTEAGDIGFRTTRIKVVGISEIENVANSRPFPNPTYTTVTSTATIYVSVGDTLTIEALQTSTNPLNVLSFSTDPARACSVNIFKIS